MADRRNLARFMLVLEILGDCRSLHEQIVGFLNRLKLTNPAAAALEGYQMLQQCRQRGQRLMALRYDPGSLGIARGDIDNTELQRQQLQRIILDVSARRFQAQKLYLDVAAGIRWVQGRQSVVNGVPGGERPNGNNAAQLQAVDQLLRQEMASFTAQHVFNLLREHDRRAGRAVDETPTLEQIAAWIRQTQ